MIATEYDCEIGDVVEEFPVQGGYPLPYGLSPGMQVRVVGMDQAWRTVERDGWEWRLYVVNVRRWMGFRWGRR
ncbi:MAG TPA: hypothetical protein VI454_13840 [Verrucomicrobiae bacterium]|jgi:hypothetical protein